MSSLAASALVGKEGRGEVEEGEGEGGIDPAEGHGIMLHYDPNVLPTVLDTGSEVACV